MEEKARKTREELYANFPTMLKEFKGKEYNTVPLYWYDMCVQFGMIEYEEGEKRVLWEEAQALEFEEFLIQEIGIDNLYNKLKKGGRAKAPMAKPTEGKKDMKKPGGKVEFGYAGKARKGKKA